jgi:GNAT superfamily N-acetyltransferase
MLDVFFRSMEDLDERRRRVLQPRDPRPLEAHLRHLQASDPRTCIVADDHGSLAAFGVAMVREGQAFLSFLFVVPAWQGRGIGRAVTLACLQAAGETLRVATCAEADQLVSTGLYASLGLAPREPIYLLRGTLDEAALPLLPPGVQAHLLDASGPPDSAVGALDLEVLGYRRPLDHAFWASGGRRGWSFEASGTLLGYGYAHPSGRIGPVAARQPDLLPAMLGHLVRGTPVLEGRQAIVPGAAAAALRLLMAAGLRMDGTPAVYCTDRPGPRLDRYLPMSFALL